MASFPPGQSRISDHRKRAAHVCACVLARRNLSTVGARWQQCYRTRRANGGSWRRTYQRCRIKWTACQHEHEYGIQGWRRWRCEHRASVIRVLSRISNSVSSCPVTCRMHVVGESLASITCQLTELARNAMLGSRAEMSIHEKCCLRASSAHACNFVLGRRHARSPLPLTYHCIVTYASHGRCLARTRSLRSHPHI